MPASAWRSAARDALFWSTVSAAFSAAAAEFSGPASPLLVSAPLKRLAAPELVPGTGAPEARVTPPSDRVFGRNQSNASRVTDPSVAPMANHLMTVPRILVCHLIAESGAPAKARPRFFP